MQNFWIYSYIFITLWAVITIIFYGSRPTKSIAWVLASIFLPFLGPLCYYFFGVNRKKFKFFRLRHSLKRQLYDGENREVIAVESTPFDNEHSFNKLVQLIENNSFLYASSGNSVTLLENGEDTFEQIFKAIEDAKHFVHMQYFILEQGQLFDRLCPLLKNKIASGVEVRIIYDSFGSYKMRGKPKRQLQEIGVKIYPILPIRFGNLLYTLNYRNHRKIVVVDGKIGFTGGVNVTDKYVTYDNPLGKWEDLHLMLKGPVVNSLHRIFIKDYYFASKEEGLLNKKYLPEPKKEGDSIVQIVSGGPDSPQSVIMQQYIAMMHLAEKSVTIANPYFIPGVAFLEAMKIVALSGIKIKLIVPKKSDSLVAKYSMFSHFESLLKVGVEIYLRNEFSHSKVLIVDNSIASVGSGNFDYRSFEHNYETNALIYDEEIANSVEARLDKYCKPLAQLHYDSFKARPRYQKFLEGLAKFMSPLL